MLLLVAGCGEGAPPLDELPLRDALRADPQVVAAMPAAARQRLAARFEAARQDDPSSDAVDSAAIPGTLVSALDDVRARRDADAFLVGAVVAGLARPVPAGDTAASAPLPELEGETATATTSLEAGALGGTAGVSLRALLAASGARRLQRVVGWPVGAIAIDDTVYVDAAWLVALAPDAGADGGASDGAAPDAAIGNGPSRGASSESIDGGARRVTFDAGLSLPPPYEPPTVVTPPAPQPPPPPPAPGPDFWDACAAGVSAGSCDDTDDDDSCSGTSGGDDDSDSCSQPPDDGADCRLSPGRSRPRATTLVWVLAPLGYLVGRRR